MIAKAGTDKSEVGRRKQRTKVCLGLLSVRAFAADELRSRPEALEACEGGFAIRAGIRPFSDSVIVTVGKKGAPQSCCGVILEAEEVTGDGASGETGEHYLCRIAAEIEASAVDRLAEVFERRLRIVDRRITPPSNGDLVAFCIQVGYAKPNEVATSGKAEPEIASFWEADAGIAEFVCVSAVARQFDKDGPFYVFVPIRRKIEHTAPPTDAFSSDWRTVAQWGDDEIRCHAGNVRQFSSDNWHGNEQEGNEFHRRS